MVVYNLNYKWLCVNTAKRSSFKYFILYLVCGLDVNLDFFASERL